MTSAPGGADGSAPVSSRAGGIQTGLVVLLTSMAGHVGNFAFYVLASRQLDPVQFAKVAAVTSMGLIVFTPLNGIAAAASREVAQSEAAGDHAGSRSYVRWLARRLLVVQAVLFAVGAAATPLSDVVFGTQDSASWLFAVVWLSLGVALFGLLGALQGYGRFALVGGILAGPLGLLRVVFLVPLGAALGVPGAVLALIAATAVGLVLIWWGLRSAGRSASTEDAARPATGRLRNLALGLVALLGFASLTNIDVVLANTVLTGSEAAVYASAALLGKIALYGPAALSIVLLPNVAARIAQGRSIHRPALLTQAAVLATGLATTLVFWLAPSALIGKIFGPAYVDAYPLLVPLSLVMTAAALLNVVVTLAIARGDRRLILGALVLAVLHVVLILAWGDSPTGIIVATATTIGLGLVVNEVISRDGVARSVLALARDRSRA